MSRKNGIGGRPLPRIAAICRFLSILCKAAFVVYALWSICAFALMCYSLASASCSNEIALYAFALPTVYLLYSANFCVLPLILCKILDDISENRTPFTMQNAKRLLLLSGALLLYAVLEALLGCIDSQFIFMAGNNSIEVGNFIRDFSSNSGTMLNLFPLLMSAMFFALSYVFKYGVLLQQESDETL